MDLFDQLKTAGPVGKDSNKKNSSFDKGAALTSNKKNLSPGKEVETSKKKISSHQKEESGHKNSSHGKEAGDDSIKNRFHGKEATKSGSNKNSSPGKDADGGSNKKKLSLGKEGDKNKKKISSHNTDIETSVKKNSSHSSSVEDNNKNSSTPGKDSQNNSKKILNHDKDVSIRKSHDQKVSKFNVKHKTNIDSNSSPRRDSMPSPVIPHAVTSKKKINKSRSLSPPKIGLTKTLKIKLDRKNVDDILDHSFDHNSSTVKVKHHDKHKDSKQQDKHKDYKQQDKHKESKQQDKHRDSKPKESKEPKKMTPTKAQQKLFEPSPVRQKKSKSQILKEFNVKPCIVRIHRDNFKKLMRDFKKNKSLPVIKPIKISKLTLGAKRPADLSPSTKSDGSPPAKKGKLLSPPKSKMNFFIKLNTPKLDKSKAEKSKSDKLKSKWGTKFNQKISSSSVAQHNKIKNSKFSATITPTKFSRSHLISSFGERWFKSYVRVEKCGHPLMLTFESNDRARRLQSKHNKSKNLSVSFREQVEVFGSSSDSDDSYDENFCPTTSRNGAGRRVNAQNAATPIVSATPVVMPARLKKVENGKVVDDILLDPSLFLDPQNLLASTPYSPGRKKRDHKSFSPLKDEGSPSPRKEQLKLANERVPPSGLRRLNIDDDDDEDDDCEYIVPIELPQRRASRTSSTNTVDGPSIIAPTFDDAINPYTSAIFTEIDEAITLAKRLVSPATIATTNTDKNATKTAGSTTTIATHIESDQTESHESFQSAKDRENRSPSLALSDALSHVAPYADVPQTNNISELNGNIGNTITNVNNAIVGDLPSINDMSMNLFIEDSQTNDGDSPEKSIVDSIINETIDKLGKDIGCDDSTGDNQQYSNAI